MRLYGNNLILTTSFQPLETPGRGVRFLNIRNANGNDVAWFSNDGVTPIGFLNASEAREFVDLATSAIFVKGTAGQTFYWDAEAY